jgi:Tfp pilus assembly protein PilV
MATFNYTVDTKPMAEEIRSVSHHVNATTGAVVAMQTAVIFAEEKAADHVCNNVNKGFYSLIRSQISQKMAKLQSDVDSHLMQLVQQKNALLSIKNRMQRDYNMIAGRYGKLFNGLNANLKQRVFELDKPTIDFAIKEVDKVSNRTKYLTATIPITQLESISLSQRIVASNIKHKGLNVINSMRSFLFEMNTQKKLTDQILINDNRYTETATIYIPIVICECNRDKTDSKNLEIIVSDVELDNFSKSAIQNTAYAEINQVEWSQKNIPNSEIKSEFSKLISSSAKSQRVKELAMQLFQSNNFQTI